MRVIATLFVVFGHSTFYTIVTEVSEMGIYCSTAINDYSIVHTVLSSLCNFVYSFHMHLFMLISGIVYGLSDRIGEYSNIRPFLMKKAR